MRWLLPLLLAGCAAPRPARETPAPRLNAHQNYKLVRLKLDQAAADFRRLFDMEEDVVLFDCVWEEDPAPAPLDPGPWLEPVPPAPAWRR